MARPVETKVILGWLSLALLVFFLLFSPESSTPFIFITILALIFIYIIVDDPKYQIEVDGRRFPDLAYGVAVFAAYIVIASLVGAFLQGAAKQTTQSIFKNLAAATIPILTGNIVATFILFAVLVPIAETVFFFGPVYEFVGKRFRADVTNFNFRNLLAMLFVSFLFTLVHFQARAIIPEAARFDDVGLILTGLFAFMSMGIMVLRSQLTGKREIAPAIIFHIVANASALLIKIHSPVAQSLFGIG